jgi:lysophospholipase L1-like esterase
MNRIHHIIRKRRFCVAVILFAASLLQSGFSQNPARFQSEIDQFKADSFDSQTVKKLILFTGSSTIRMWTDLKKDFPDRSVLNRGFGGSCMSDLLFYADTVILRYRPELIMIYEGDNDLAAGKNPKDIILDAGKLVSLIRKALPESVICFFAAKPSISRWNLKDVYLQFNRQLKDFTAQYPKVYFLDMWNQMLDNEGKPDPDIFIGDGLHMNRKGYDIWKTIAGEFLDTVMKR